MKCPVAISPRNKVRRQTDVYCEGHARVRLRVTVDHTHVVVYETGNPRQTPINIDSPARPCMRCCTVGRPAGSVGLS